MVTALIINGSLYLISILWGPIKSTQSVFYGVSSNNLVGSLPFFCWAFITLSQVTLLDFLSDSIYYSVPE